MCVRVSGGVGGTKYLIANFHPFSKWELMEPNKEKLEATPYLAGVEKNYNYDQYSNVTEKWTNAVFIETLVVWFMLHMEHLGVIKYQWVDLNADKSYWWRFWQSIMLDWNVHKGTIWME